jgi:hypothetical protein
MLKQQKILKFSRFLIDQTDKDRKIDVM